MAAGLGALRLAPRDFWSMTPKELAAALGSLSPAITSAPTRDDLDRLMARYPDMEQPHG